TLPVAMTDDRKRRRTWHIVHPCVEHSADRGGYTEETEIVSGDEPAPRVLELGMRRIDLHVEPRRVPGREHTAEEPTVVADVLVEGIRNDIGAHRAIPACTDVRRVADDDELLRMRHRQSAHHHRV